MKFDFNTIFIICFGSAFVLGMLWATLSPVWEEWKENRKRHRHQH